MTPTPAALTVPGYTQVIEWDGRSHLTPEQFAQLFTPAEHERALRILWPMMTHSYEAEQVKRKESAR